MGFWSSIKKEAGRFFGDGDVKDFVAGGKADVLDLWGTQEEDKARSAEEEAAATQEDAATRALAEQRRQYDQTRMDTQRQLGVDRGIARNQYDRAQTQMRPWLEAGGSALAKQTDLLGLGEEGAQQRAYDNYSMSPGQQFLRDRGEKAMVRNASAIGGLGGGNVRSDLQQQGIGFAAQDFGNYYNRLAGMSGTGQNTAGQMGQMGGSYAGQMGQLGNSAMGRLGAAGQNFGNAAAQQYGLAGNARASGIFGQQQASANQQGQTNDLIKTGLSFFSDNRLKEDIKKVSELNGHNLYSWTWKDNHPETEQRGKSGFGVIAQEVEKTRPDVINEHESGYKTVDYNSLFGGALCH